MIYALILYSFIILVFISGNIILWFVTPEFQLLDPESRTVYAVCGLFVILMIIGFVLSWQIRRQSLAARNRASSSSALHFNNSTGDANVNSNSNQVSAASSPIHSLPPPPPIHRHGQQQQQQQQHLQQSSHLHHSHPPQQQLIISTSGSHSIHRPQVTTTSIHGQDVNCYPGKQSSSQTHQQQDSTGSGSSGSNLLTSPLTSPPPVPPAPSLEHLTSGHPSHLNITKITNHSALNLHHMGHQSSSSGAGGSGGRDSSLQQLIGGTNSSQMTVTANSTGNHSSSILHPSASASMVQIITNRPTSAIAVGAASGGGGPGHGHSHNTSHHSTQGPPSSTFH